MTIVTELRNFAEKFPEGLKRSTITDRADELIQFVKESLILTVKVISSYFLANMKGVLKKEQPQEELERCVGEFNNQCITFLESCVPCLEDFCERCESSCRFLFYCLQCKRLMCASCRTELHSAGKWTQHDALGW